MVKYIVHLETEVKDNFIPHANHIILQSPDPLSPFFADGSIRQVSTPSVNYLAFLFLRNLLHCHCTEESGNEKYLWVNAQNFYDWSTQVL